MAGYRDAWEELQAEKISVVALSADPLEKAKGTVDEERLPFPVAWGLRQEDAERIGALFDPKRGIIQPSEFLLGSERKVIHRTYSSGPVGRMIAPDVLKLVRILSARKKG